MSTKILAALLLFPIAALADGYDSPDEAAIAALSVAIPLSEKYEFAGAIYRSDGRYFYTEPKSSGKRHSVEVLVTYPRGSKLIALYHTHPEGKRSELFSPQDVDVASQIGVPYYIGHYADRAMRMFRPGSEVSKRRPGTSVRGSRWAEGELIGYAVEPEKTLPNN